MADSATYVFKINQLFQSYWDDSVYYKSSSDSRYLDISYLTWEWQEGSFPSFLGMGEVGSKDCAIMFPYLNSGDRGALNINAYNPEYPGEAWPTPGDEFFLAKKSDTPFYCGVNFDDTGRIFKYATGSESTETYPTITWLGDYSVQLTFYYDRKTHTRRLYKIEGAIEVDSDGNKTLTVNRSTRTLYKTEALKYGASQALPSVEELSDDLDGFNVVQSSNGGIWFQGDNVPDISSDDWIEGGSKAIMTSDDEYTFVYIVPDSEKLVKFGTLESMLSTYKAKSDAALDAKLDALPSGGVSAEDVDAKVAEAVEGMESDLAEAVGDMEAKLSEVASVPSDGTEGQVLTKTADSYEWADAAGEVPVATYDTPGTVIVGDNLTIDADGRLSAVRQPVFDDATGRYSNESISAWLDSYADGLVYGIQIPRYKNSTSTEAVKLGANAGLVLEPSSDTVAGRNDYLGRKLFMCPRVNGGVDADGMPYVTAIEGFDSRFDAEAADTWALTPVYWRKLREGDAYAYLTHYYCDSPRSGYSPCPGAYVPDGRMRPYILRACYMDSDGDCSSRSGRVPASGLSSELEGYYPHSPDTMLSESQVRDDGKSYLSYADLSWKLEFMQLMLGVKAPSTKVAGNGRAFSAKLLEGVDNGRDIAVGAVNGQEFKAGDHVSIGSVKSIFNKNAHKACFSVRVSKAVFYEDDEDLGDYWFLQLDEKVTATEGMYVNVGAWRTGACDGVMGTYGSFDLANLEEGGPARFQNVEFQLGGTSELCCDALVYKKVPYIAPDVGSCGLVTDDDVTALTDLDGWVTTGEAMPSGNDYLADRLDFHGLSYPWNIGATSTTGYAASYYLTHSDIRAWSEESLGDDSNVGGQVFYYGWCDAAEGFMGTRASSIGRSLLAD